MQYFEICGGECSKCAPGCTPWKHVCGFHVLRISCTVLNIFVDGNVKFRSYLNRIK